MKKIKILNILFIAIFATVFGIAVLASETIVTVTGNVSYVDTGVDVEAGDVLKITSSGYWCWASWEPGSCSGPDGSAPPYDRAYEGDLLVFTAPHGALVGRIGSGDWFLVGSNYEETAATSGRLLLADNDNAVSGGYGDNTGSVQAIIEVNPAVAVVAVTIDIKPDSFPNSINLKSKGNVPVAILSDSTFDATTVDKNTVIFAGVSPLPIGQTPEDMNGDGLLDIVLHFKTQDLDLQTDNTEACLSGKTSDEQDIEGCDSVRIVK